MKCTEIRDFKKRETEQCERVKSINYQGFKKKGEIICAIPLHSGNSFSQMPPF